MVDLSHSLTLITNHICRSQFSAVAHRHMYIMPLLKGIEAFSTVLGLQTYSTCDDQLMADLCTLSHLAIYDHKYYGNYIRFCVHWICG